MSPNSDVVKNLQSSTQVYQYASVFSSLEDHDFLENRKGSFD